MNTQNATNSIEITRRKEKNFVIFDRDGIKIPENLSSLIKGDITSLIADNFIRREHSFYIFKVNPEIKLKIRKKLRMKKRNQKYTISFGIGLGFFLRPILEFKNLDHEKYEQILQILEANNIFTREQLTEFDNFANDWIYTGNTYRNFAWGLLSTLTIFSGLVLTELLTGNYRIVLLLYYIFNGLYFFFNIVFPLPLRGSDSNPDKQRKIHIIQKIAGYIFILFVSFVWILAFAI